MLETSVAQPWAGCVLSGAVTPQQVRSNAAATRIALPSSVLEELAGLAEDPADYWSARSRRPWS